MPTKKNLKDKLKEKAQQADERVERTEPEPMPVSAGPIDKVVDMVFNASREKELEFTNLDRNQVRLIPQLVIEDLMWDYCEGIMWWRYDRDKYEQIYKTDTPPTTGNLIKEFVHLTAQCNKSLEGKNMQSAIDVTLADIEREAYSEKDPFRENWDDFNERG